MRKTTSRQLRKLAQSGFVLLPTFVLFVICLYLNLSPLRSPGIGLDPSWMRVLDQAFLERWQFGRDIIFTYGPLGFLGNVLITSENLTVWVASAVLMAVVWFAFLYSMTREYPWQMPAALVILILVAPLTYFGADSAFLCMPFLAFVAARNGQRRIAILMFFAAAIFSHVKLTYGVATVILAVLADIERRPFCVVFAGAGFVIAYLCAGQSPMHFLDYLYYSGQIVSGYSDAMAVYGDRLQILVFLAFSAALIAGCWFLPGSSAHRIVRCVGFRFACFLIFKSSFVRHTDLRYTYAIAQLGIFATILFFAGAQTTRRPALSTALVVAFVGAWTLGTLYFAPLERFHETNELKAAAGFIKRKTSLPVLSLSKLYSGRVRHRLGSTVHFDGISQAATLDVLNWNAALALDSNLAYRPRPVFQSYAVYTTPLARRNLDSFHRAPPDALLYSAQAIGHRWPGMADSLLLPELFERYDVVAQTQDGALLRRSVNPASCSVEQLTGTGTFGTAFIAPVFEQANLVVLSLETEHTLGSHLRKLFFKAPIYRIDAMAGEDVVRSHAVPLEMARIGLPVQPVFARGRESAAFRGVYRQDFQRLRFYAGDAILPTKAQFRYTFRAYRCEKPASAQVSTPAL